MLRSGLVLLMVSSVGVILRTAEVIDLHTPLFKGLCSLTLLISVACFVGTYCMAEFAHNKTRLHR